MSLLTYSGITTKVRAMESRLLTERQFQDMAALEDVRSAAEYLRQQPAYAGIFTDLDDSLLHRGYIEQLLTQSEYRDFTKLYRFASLSQQMCMRDRASASSKAPAHPPCPFCISDFSRFQDNPPL